MHCLEQMNEPCRTLLCIFCYMLMCLMHDAAEEPEAKDLSEPPRLLGAFTSYEVRECCIGGMAYV